MTERNTNRVFGGLSHNPAEIQLPPQGWRAMAQRYIDSYRGDAATIEVESARRWTERTGVAPEDSHFTLILPIHNEEAFLPDALAALSVSDIPQGVDLNVVFVTNKSTDRSSDIVREYMEGLGEVEQATFDHTAQFADAGLQPEYAHAQQGSIHFTHVNTETAGKANALNIGNAIAIENGHRIAMSMDANNFLEPDALGNMFAQAHKSIISEPDGTVNFWGQPTFDMRPNAKFKRLKSYVKRHAAIPGADKVEELQKVHGWFMAWDTGFVSDEVGGIPLVAGVDYALSAVSRNKGGKTQRVTGARVWGYESSTVKDRLSEYSRYVRGLHQLVDQRPEVEGLVRQERYVMKPGRERARLVFSAAVHHPEGLPLSVPTVGMLELAIRKGKKQYRRNPTNASWDSVRSTKK